MSLQTESYSLGKPEIGNIDFEAEKQTLKSFLESVSIPVGKPQAFLGGSYSVWLNDDSKPEAWFNITVRDLSATVIEIRYGIDEIAHHLFDKLRNSNADINSFVLSFHISIDEKSRNIFFRATRQELNAIYAQTGDARALISRLPNKLYDELFRDL